MYKMRQVSKTAEHAHSVPALKCFKKVPSQSAVFETCLQDDSFTSDKIQGQLGSFQQLNKSEAFSKGGGEVLPFIIQLQRIPYTAILYS